MATLPTTRRVRAMPVLLKQSQAAAAATDVWRELREFGRKQGVDRTAMNALHFGLHSADARTGS